MMHNYYQNNRGYQNPPPKNNSKTIIALSVIIFSCTIVSSALIISHAINRANSIKDTEVIKEVVVTESAYTKEPQKKSITVTENPTIKTKSSVSTTTPTPKPATKSNNITYQTYTNDRFCYKISFPSFLNMAPPPDNNDGRQFYSDDNSFEMSVWGSHFVLVSSFEEEYEYCYENLGFVPTYKYKGQNSFVFSGIKDNKIIYVKAIKVAEGVAYAELRYSQSLKKEMDSVVTNIASSFKAT